MLKTVISDKGDEKTGEVLHRATCYGYELTRRVMHVILGTIYTRHLGEHLQLILSSVDFLKPTPLCRCGSR